MLSLTFSVPSFYLQCIGQFNCIPRKLEIVRSKRLETAEENSELQIPNLDCENHKTDSGFPRKL